MATQYVSKEKTKLYKSATEDEDELVLIFGDEVKTSGSPVNGRIQAEFRGRNGFIKEDDLMDDSVLEIYFADVGTGDSIFIVTPGRKKILIDGGSNQRAMRFLAWKYQLDKITGPIDIDYVVCSHADGDHIKGLIPLIAHPKIQVHNVIDSGIATYKKGVFRNELGDLDASAKYLITRNKDLQSFKMSELSKVYAAWVKALVADNVAYSVVSSSSGSLNIGDSKISIDILGPRLDILNNQEVYQWFGSVPQTINGHSVVLKLRYGNVSAIFAGDINEQSSKHLLEDPAIAAKVDAHIFKAPHHGSRDYDPQFIKAVRPQVTVISSGDEPDYGHPRACFIGAVGKHSRADDPLVFSTKIAAIFTEEKASQPKVKDAPISASKLKTDEGTKKAGALFRRRLYGMINVRTDGKKIFAARRISGKGNWELYLKAPVA